MPVMQTNDHPEQAACLRQAKNGSITEATQIMLFRSQLQLFREVTRRSLVIPSEAEGSAVLLNLQQISMTDGPLFIKSEA
jgi:succinylarginine dihydrolase